MEESGDRVKPTSHIHQQFIIKDWFLVIETAPLRILIRGTQFYVCDVYLFGRHSIVYLERFPIERSKRKDLSSRNDDIRRPVGLPSRRILL